MGDRAFVLLGPTASGKSTLAMALAAEFPVEIVSMDSAQVYRGMDIGTAKSSPAERLQVPHHLIDLIDPTGRYSAGRFRADAIAAITDILARGRIPFVVGGTMLYYRALAGGLDELPPADAAVRAAIDADAAQRGWPALHRELASIDAATASRLAPNDGQRIQRALEVFRLTGQPLAVLQRARPAPLPFELRSFGLATQDRTALHARIAARFDAMLKAGLVDELRTLRNRHALTPDLPSMRCVGYRQAWEHLEGAYDASILREKVIAATRQLAKRQLTWLRGFSGIEPADPAAMRRALGAA